MSRRQDIRLRRYEIFMKYDSLAAVYDSFTDGFDYRKYLDSVFSHCDKLPRDGLALDCGSGTGTLMCELSSRGFSCTGVDISEDMLNVARDKLEAAGYEPHLVCQLLQELDLYGAYDIAFCSLDTVNHILYKRDLKAFFKRLYNFIEPGGYFVFDVKTAAGFKKTRGIQVFCHEDGSAAMIRGSFSSDIALYFITVFETRADGLFERYESEIEERCYSSETLESLIAEAGFMPIKRFGSCGRQTWITARREHMGKKLNG